MRVPLGKNSYITYFFKTNDPYVMVLNDCKIREIIESCPYTSYFCDYTVKQNVNIQYQDERCINKVCLTLTVDKLKNSTIRIIFYALIGRLMNTSSPRRVQIKQRH